MRKSVVFATAACIAAAMACSKQSANPTSPSVTAALSGAAGTDGSTLKVSAPTAQSPINDQQPTDLNVTLVVANAAGKFTTVTGLSYRFEIFNQASTRVYVGTSASGSGSTTSHLVTAELEGDLPYTWQARAEIGADFGPWSARASFVAPTSRGYIRGNELYDPLVNGTTIGTVHGPVTFIPGVGVRMDDLTSYISYQLQTPLQDGEYSLLTTNIATNSEGNKTKVMAMAEGFGDIRDNDARMTVEKRGDNPTGGIAWRFISSNDTVETVGAERVAVDFDPSALHLWTASWRSSIFNVNIQRGGAGGQTVYNFGKHYGGFYAPEPHVVYVGGPTSISGPDNQTVPGMIVRQVWVSSRGRPSFANR